MSVFGAYADYYDVVYKNKSYAAECRFVHGLFDRYASRPVTEVLDLGCGTGGHALALAAGGLKVTGLDASARMLAQARAKAKQFALPLRCVRGKLQTFNLSRKFDAVICMFSVIDYLTQESDLNATLANVRRHLKPGGIFIADFWHAPAVASFTPYKQKLFSRQGITVQRESHTRIFPKKRLCEVRYQCRVTQPGRQIPIIKETHRMRYFDIEEINGALKAAGLMPLAAGPFLNIDKPIRPKTWDVTVVAGLPKRGARV